MRRWILPLLALSACTGGEPIDLPSAPNVSWPLPAVSRRAAGTVVAPARGAAADSEKTSGPGTVTRDSPPATSVASKSCETARRAPVAASEGMSS